MQWFLAMKIINSKMNKLFGPVQRI